MSAFAERLKDFFWPRTCPVEDCGVQSDREGLHICSKCRESLPWFDEYGGAALAYLPPVPDLIGAFKFGGAMHLAEDFAEIMEAAYRKKHDAAAVDLVVPVPLHPARLRERGYNQSGLVAEAFARRLNRVCDTRSFVRVRNTVHQSRSSGEERRRNLAGAFKATDPSRIRGRTIVLVDDVITTGSTMSECSKTLLAAGAYRVIPFSIAKALMDEDLQAAESQNGNLQC